MPDQITTKPMRSQAQWRFLFAAGLPFARRWARSTPGGEGARFRRLPRKVAKKADPKTTVQRLWATGVKPDDIIGIWYSPSDGTWFVEGGDWAAPGTGEKVKAVFGANTEWADEYPPAKGSKFTVRLKANYGARVGQTIAGRLVRGSGGRFASSGSAPSPGAARLNAARDQALAKPKPPKGGAGGRKPPKPKKQTLTPEQRQQQRLAERAAAQAATLGALGIAPDGQEALSKLAAGEEADDAALARGGFEAAGLVERGLDGKPRLTPAGRQLLNAAARGDKGAAGAVIGRARDRETARQQKPPKAAGGGGGGKKPKEKPPTLPARQTSQAPRVVSGGGGGAARPAPARAEQPTTDPELAQLAQRLSAGEQLTDDEAQQLIRNGLAREVRGRLVLTQAGQRATRGKAYKAIAPTRTTDAGHTGVMVALYPDQAAAKALTSLDGVTEPQEQLHLTLCFLGDSTEQPLATNKEKVIAAIDEWATAHGQPLKGTINGLGRFFQTEDGDTNAVYVAPDVPGLPELRQSLAEWIEQSGFDYSQDHGFTPHITVAYVPKDAPTPDIRVETPVAFDRVTLAWGDEVYEFPMGMRTKATGSPGDYLVVEDRTKSSTWHLQVKRNGRPDHGLMGAAWAALHGGYRGNTYQGPNKTEALAKLKRLYASEGMDVPTEKAASFTVFKQRDGSYRWVAYSSNAYRDRDQEIVSTKALAEDCARADADGQYGPLRWWHVGGPHTPGWDLGVCDFNAMHGRVLVESGTFKSAAIGAAVEKAAPQLQLSIGFTHTPDEPDRQGVFHHIRRFERSLVPTGRAANPFTRLIVKETHMDKEKEAALKSHLGADVAAAVLAGAETVQKEADDLKTAFKSADPWSAVGAAIAQAIQAALVPAAELAAESVVEKAPPPADAAAEMTEEVVEEQAIEPMDDTGGEMSADEFLAQIGALIDQKLAPLAGLLDIEKKVAGHVQTLMQPFQTQKDATDAERQQEIATLKAAVEAAQTRLAALEGDVPSGVGYRPSQATDNVATKEQAEALTGVVSGDEEWNRIMANIWKPVSTNGQTPI